MEFQRGQLTAVAIIIAIMTQGMGGFLLNQKDVSVTNTDFSYITDVYGAFHGSKQDIPVDFNPRENITGYYPSEPDAQSKYKIPQIQYNSANIPNGYPYANQERTYNNYTVEIHSNKSDGQGVDVKDSYSVKVTNRATMQSFNYSWTSDNDLTRYSGLYNSISPILVDSSRIFIESSEHEAPRVISIQELLSHVTQFSGKDCSLNYTSGGLYPCFVSKLANHYDESEWGVHWYEYTYNERSNIAYANTSISSFTIHNETYNLSEGWLVFGSRDNHDITIEVTTSEPDISNMYIDPNAGVSPASMAGTVTETETVWHYSDGINIDLDVRAKSSTPIITEDDCRINWGGIIQIKIKGTSNDILIPLVEVEWYEYFDMRGSDFGYYNRLTIYEVNQDGSRTGRSQSVSDEIFDHLNIDFSNNTTQVHVFTGDGAGENWINEYYNVQGIEQDHPVIKYVGMYNQRVWDILNDKWGVDIITESLNYPDFYKNKQYRNSMDSEYFADVYYTSEEPIVIPFENHTTYWYNGYSNSTIGMIVSSGLTKFNLKLHDPITLEDNWIYGDVNKQSIYVNTIAGNMMVVGYVKADGTLDETNRIMIGAVNQIYIELVCDQTGQIHLYQSPIYDFTNFMNYTLITPSDVTQAIQPLIDEEGLTAKSITEIGYYNPGGHWEGTDDNMRWIPEVMPRQLVVRTVILLDAGGLYIQDGVLNLKEQFPQYPLSEFIVNAVVHPGDSMSLISNGNILATIKTDGVDKWLYHSPNESESKQKSYDWWDLKVFYVQSNNGLWVNGQYFDSNHVYIQAGQWGNYDDWGQLADGDLTIRMDGVWAFSTQYYEGKTSTSHGIEFAEPGTWHWSKEEFMVVFTGVLVQSQAILYYTRGYSLLDILVFGGQIGLIWAIF